LPSAHPARDAAAAAAQFRDDEELVVLDADIVEGEDVGM